MGDSPETDGYTNLSVSPRMGQSMTGETTHDYNDLELTDNPTSDLLWTDLRGIGGANGREPTNTVSGHKSSSVDY